MPLNPLPRRSRRASRLASVAWRLVAALLTIAAAPAPGTAQRLTPADGAVRRVTRAPDGSPGPGYWQQEVDYDLDVALDPSTHRLTGRGTIVYHNNSPDAIGELHWHLYYNVFRAGAITVTRLETAAGLPLPQNVRGTLMRTPLPALLASGDSLVLRVEWTAAVPAMPTSAIEAEGSDLAARRTGYVGEDYAIAQWYPQVSVYDDVHGWHDLPYLGQGEFYLEYGDWDVRLTVPRRYAIAATGTLANPDAVLAPAQAAALRSLGTVAPGRLVRVVTPADTAGAGAPEGATRTWHFTAERVRDFAWAASPRFLWNATRTRPTPTQPAGVRIHSFFVAEQAADYARSWDVARRTIELFSERVSDYAYPQATTVSGPAVGMEYPMLAFEGETARLGSGYLNMPEQVTVHELGHQWFPMMVGSNETRHPFMDEGFTTFLEITWFRENYGRGGFFSPRMPLWLRGLAGRGDHRRLTADLGLLVETQAPNARVPLMTAADQVPPEMLGAVAYEKPAMVLVMLREVVGDSMFDRALREYARQWQFRHPYPDDFFNTVERVAGRDLDWFWRPWVFGTAALDVAIDSVTSRDRGTRWEAALALRNPSGIAVPVTVRLTLDGGAVRTVRLPETLWLGGAVAATATVPGLPARVSAAELDPTHLLYEANHANNVWPARTRPAEGSPLGVTGAGLLGLALLTIPPLLAARLAGRTAGARLGGFAPVRIALGNSALWNRLRGVALRRIPRPRLYRGGTLALPPLSVDGASLARSTGRTTSAAPLASLTVALAAALALYARQRLHDAGGLPDGNFLIDSWLAGLLALAALSFALSLLPRGPGGRYLAPAPWLRLLLSPSSARAQRWSAVQALRAQSFAGERPRGWNPAWVATAVSAPDGSATDAGACMLAYLWALDRGDTPEAVLFLDRAWTTAGRRWWWLRIRRHIRAEQAFHAAYLEGDAAEGARLASGWRLLGAPRHARRRAQVAILLGEANRPQAGALARAGLLDDARTTRWGGAGVATFERYWLAVLLAAADRRVGSAVVTPSVSSVAILAQLEPASRGRRLAGRGWLRGRGNN